MAIYQIFVKLLDGRTQCLQISTPTISGETLKRNLFAKTRIPERFQRLVTGSRVVSNETLISVSADGLFPSCALLLRLPGGKGGFGSLLRGAATKAGQKKTNNFDACRDMSGRRLRHVNAEKKLEEWKSEAEDRRLEKLADQFLKKKAKENKKNSSVDVNKFLMKYREDSDKCMGEVEESVRQSFDVYKELKRKIRPTGDSSSKRVKIWLGKGKVEESSSEEEEDDDDDYDNNDDTEKKSVVLDDGNSPRHIKKVEGSSSMVANSGIDSDGSSSMVASSGIGSDGEITGGTSDQSNLGQAKGSMLDDVSSCKSSELSNLEESHENVEMLFPAVDQSSYNMESSFDLVAASNVMKAPENVEAKLNLHSQIGSDLCEETVAQSIENSSFEEPLNFDKYNSPAELEVLGMDRLKAELQARGLKCGGTLPERASRLYLLKTTPFDKLPKKFLAKPPK